MAIRASGRETIQNHINTADNTELRIETTTGYRLIKPVTVRNFSDLSLCLAHAKVITSVATLALLGLTIYFSSIIGGILTLGAGILTFDAWKMDAAFSDALENEELGSSFFTRDGFAEFPDFLTRKTLVLSSFFRTPH